jgi:glycine C-acetyltransferase
LAGFLDVCAIESQPDNSLLAGTLWEFHDPHLLDLADRWHRAADWIDRRAAARLMPGLHHHSGPIAPRIAGHLADGRAVTPRQFAVRDSLALSRHPHLLESAHAALGNLGTLATAWGSPIGPDAALIVLERHIADFLGYRGAVTFPSGAMAFRAVFHLLLGPNDHVVMDDGVDPDLLTAAKAGQATVHVKPSPSGLAAALHRLRRRNPHSGILVVTASLLAWRGIRPDLAAAQNLCRRYRATLLVDVSHDIGATGPDGRGLIGLQDLTGGIDIVVGDLSGSFATAGGFVATNHVGLQMVFRHGNASGTMPGGLSPVQVAVADAALTIIGSPEGDHLRQRLMTNVTDICGGLRSAGFDVVGAPVAMVPVVLGDLVTARRMTVALAELGVILDLVAPPVVSRNRCGWQVHVTAAHTAADIDDLITKATIARQMIGSTQPVQRKHRKADPADK